MYMWTNNMSCTMYFVLSAKIVTAISGPALTAVEQNSNRILYSCQRKKYVKLHLENIIPFSILYFNHEDAVQQLR